MNAISLFQHRQGVLIEEKLDSIEFFVILKHFLFSSSSIHISEKCHTRDYEIFIMMNHFKRFITFKKTHYLLGDFMLV